MSATPTRADVATALEVPPAAVDQLAQRPPATAALLVDRTATSEQARETALAWLEQVRHDEP